MSAFEVDLYKHIYHSNKLDHNDISLTETGLQSINNLLGEIEKIKPTYPDKRWEFWFSVPRGTLKQYIKFNKYYAPEDCSEEKFQKDMEEEFPWKRVWFKIGVINENGYVVVFLDDTVLVRRSPDMKGDFFPDSRLDRILKFLSQVVASTVEILKQGVYNDYVKKGLPYENRKGVINRALYWKLVPKSKRYDRDGLKEREIDKLIKHIKNGNDLFATKASGRYERMSSGKYYEVCSYCYAAAGYEELDGKTSKEMFKRHGDDRDGGMSLLDENSQAKELVQSLLEDEEFQELSIDERNAVIERILSDIKGRMMEDIVLLETKIANPKKQVFQLQFAVGEFDMVVADNTNATCEIYEVKHSKAQAKEQYRHLIDEEKLKNTEFRYGKISKRTVIYRGENTTLENGIEYRNVEEYLKSLL